MKLFDGKSVPGWVTTLHVIISSLGKTLPQRGALEGKGANTLLRNPSFKYTVHQPSQHSSLAFHCTSRLIYSNTSVLRFGFVNVILRCPMHLIKASAMNNLPVTPRVLLRIDSNWMSRYQILHNNPFIQHGKDDLPLY